MLRRSLLVPERMMLFKELVTDVQDWKLHKFVQYAELFNVWRTTYNYSVHHFKPWKL